jgi:LysM repeat protein
MPEITLSLPVALVLLAAILAIGAGVVFFTLRGTGQAVEAVQIAATATETYTPSPTTTPTPVTPTATDTPQPTPTPLSYTIQTGDTCAAIAFNFGVSIQSIVLLNNLPAECSPLSVGTTLLIPQPTPTPTSLPTSTLSAAEATEQACGKENYVVQEGDTLMSIANNFNVPMAVIQEYNGMSSENVLLGMNLIIPLCERYPTPGPTPTATLPPPYAAPNLLLPPDGARFVQTNDTVTLQWASVGTLLENEAYAVNVVDITDDEDRKLVQYVTDTKLNVPASFRSSDSTPRIYRWWVVPSRQTGTDEDGNAVWEPAGAASVAWIFMWSGAGPIPQVTSTP